MKKDFISSLINIYIFYEEAYDSYVENTVK